MTFAGGGTLAGSGVNAIVTVGLEETTYGTAAAAQMWGGLLEECVFVREDQIYESRGITNLRTLNSQTNIATRYKGSIRGNVDCGVPLAMALGNISATTDPTLSVFKGVEHTTPTKTYLPSWTIHRTYDEATDDSVNILGWTCERGEFTIDLDGPFKFSLDGTAKAQGTTAATAQTSPATALGSWDTTVKVNEGDATYSGGGTGVTVDGLKSVAFTVNNNLRIKNNWGSAPATIRQPVPGIADLELSLTRGFIDDDFWDDLCDGTIQSFQVLATDGTTSLTAEFDSCYCKTVTHTTNLDDQSQEVAKFSVNSMDCDVADSITYVAWD